MPNDKDNYSPEGAKDNEEYAQVRDTIPEIDPSPKDDSTGEFLFQVFCAVIFLGMIGLVFYNAMLRYIFSSSFPPSEEWSRFLFMYITFFGSIEAFYRKKHIAVDMFVDMFHGAKRKFFDVAATVLGIFAMSVIAWGSIVYIGETYDTSSIATNVNMTFIYGTLPIMAIAALIIQVRDLIAILRKPAEYYGKN